MSYLADGAAHARSSLLLAGQNQALQLAVSGAALAEVLEILVQTAETQSEGNFLCSILLMDEDGKHLIHGAAPSLPAAYNAAIDGIEIGPSVGSCGTAAHFGHAIIVTHIERDPLWANFRALALEHGLRACWSTPFMSKDGKVLGTFALYYKVPRSPSAHERETVNLIANTAGLVVENAQLYAKMRDMTERAQLAADAGGLGFFTWTVSTDKVVWHNQRTYEIFGINPKDEPITAKRFVDEFLHPDDRSLFATAVADSVESRLPFHFKGRIYKKPTRTLRWVEFKGQLDSKALDMGVHRVVGIAADVSDRHQS